MVASAGHWKGEDVVFITTTYITTQSLYHTFFLNLTLLCTLKLLGIIFMCPVYVVTAFVHACIPISFVYGCFYRL